MQVSLVYHSWRTYWLQIEYIHSLRGGVLVPREGLRRVGEKLPIAISRSLKPPNFPRAKKGLCRSGNSEHRLVHSCILSYWLVKSLYFYFPFFNTRKNFGGKVSYRAESKEVSFCSDIITKKKITLAGNSFEDRSTCSPRWREKKKHTSRFYERNT